MIDEIAQKEKKMIEKPDYPFLFPFFYFVEISSWINIVE